MGGQTLMSLVAQLRSWGVDDKRAEEIARQFTDSKGDVPYFNNPGQKRYGADTLYMALQKAAQEALYGSGRSNGKQVTQTPSVNRTVTISLGAQSTEIGVASDRDGDALIGVLKQLEGAARSSS